MEINFNYFLFVSIVYFFITGHNLIDLWLWYRILSKCKVDCSMVDDFVYVKEPITQANVEKAFF